MDVSQGEIDRLMAQINRAQKKAGKSMGHAINMAMRAVLTSLAKRTKVSKEFRDYKHVGQSGSGKTQKYEVTTKYVTPSRKGKSLRRSWQGPMRPQMIYAKDESELKKRPAVIISLRGLAKQTWVEANKKGIDWKVSGALIKQNKNKHNARVMKKTARRWASAELHLKGDDPWVRVTNKLSYIEDALEGGSSAVSMAIGKAASAMEKTLDNQIARAMGAK
jgi:hypothetical protein